VYASLLSKYARKSLCSGYDPNNNNAAVEEKNTLPDALAHSEAHSHAHILPCKEPLFHIIAKAEIKNNPNHIENSERLHELGEEERVGVKEVTKEVGKGLTKEITDSTSPDGDTAIQAVGRQSENEAGLNESSNHAHFRTFPQGSWQIKEDVPGKWGFITEKASPIDENGLRTIELPISPSTHLADWLKSAQAMKGLELRITFLRTYSNVSTAEIHICGEPVGFLDALWRDHESFKFSLVQSASFDVGEIVRKKCLTPQPDNWNIRIISPVDLRDKNRKIANELDAMLDPNVNEIDKRRNEKFKIMSVTIQECT